MIRPLGPASLVRPEVRRLSAYHLDLTPCRHKLDQNEVPWDLPRRIKLAVAEGLLDTDWARYPDFHGDALRRDLGKLHNWPWEGILVGNGSNELLSTALEAMAGPGTEVLGVEPTFGLYRMFVMRSGGVPRFLMRSDLTRPSLFMDELEAEVERNPKRPVLLCTPNNPTGDALPPEWVAALLERLEGPLLLDNAYGEFCRFDYRPLLHKYPHLVLFRTFSKAWSLAGLRLGYLMARPALVSELIKVKLPYNLGHAAVLAGRAVLAEEEEEKRRVRIIVARRAQWARMLAEEGFEVFPSEANFLLIRCASSDKALEVRDGLAARGIRLRDVGHYPGLANCLRVSVGSGMALRETHLALAEIREGKTLTPRPPLPPALTPARERGRRPDLRSRRRFAYTPLSRGSGSAGGRGAGVRVSKVERATKETQISSPSTWTAARARSKSPTASSPTCCKPSRPTPASASISRRAATPTSTSITRWRTSGSPWARLWPRRWGTGAGSSASPMPTRLSTRRWLGQWSTFRGGARSPGTLPARWPPGG